MKFWISEKVWVQIKLNLIDGLQNHSRVRAWYRKDTILKGFYRLVKRKLFKVFKPKDKCNVGCSDYEDFDESAGACSRPGLFSDISLLVTWLADYDSRVIRKKDSKRKEGQCRHGRDENRCYFCHTESQESTVWSVRGPGCPSQCCKSTRLSGLVV